MVEEARYPKFNLPKTVSFGKPVDRGEGHRPGLEITAEVVPEEIKRVREYYKRPAKGNFQEEGLLKSLAQKRRLGVAGYTRIAGTSYPFAFTEDGEKVRWKINRQTTKEDYIAQITQAVKESQTKEAPANNEEFLEREGVRYKAIGFAEEAWLNGNFVTALEAYRAARWLDADVPAAKVIPQKLGEILLEPYLKASKEETKIAGRNEKGEEIIGTITPTERMKKILAIRDRLEEWKSEDKLTPAIETHFSKFLHLNREKLNHDYQQAKLLELSQELFVPEEEHLHRAGMAGYEIKEQLIGEELIEGVIPAGKGLENLERAFRSLDPRSFAIKHLTEGIKDGLIRSAPELAIKIISEGLMADLKMWYSHAHNLGMIAEKYRDDPEIGRGVINLIEAALSKALTERAKELTTSAAVGVFVSAFKRTKGPRSHYVLGGLEQMEAGLKRAEAIAKKLAGEAIAKKLAGGE